MEVHKKFLNIESTVNQEFFCHLQKNMKNHSFFYRFSYIFIISLLLPPTMPSNFCNVMRTPYSNTNIIFPPVLSDQIKMFELDHYHLAGKKKSPTFLPVNLGNAISRQTIIHEFYFSFNSSTLLYNRDYIIEVKGSV